MTRTNPGEISGGPVRRRRWRGLCLALSVGLAAFACMAAATSAHADGPAVCPQGESAQTLHFESFESSPINWRATGQNGIGGRTGGEGQLDESHWYFPPPRPGRQPWSGSLNLWADILPDVPEAPQKGDSAVEMLSDLALPSDARLLFVHRFDFTALAGSYGSVERSLDGGQSWYSMGAFSTSVPAPRSTLFDLSDLAGHKVRLRFRVLTPAGSPGEQPETGSFRGWAIDDVHFYTCSDQAGSSPVPSAPPVVKVEREALRLQGSALKLDVLRLPLQLPRRAKTRLRLTLTNPGPTLRRVRVCFQAPRRRLTGRRCTLIRKLPSRASAHVSFPVRVNAKGPRRKARLLIRFAAYSGNQVLATALRRFRLGPP